MGRIVFLLLLGLVAWLGWRLWLSARGAGRGARRGDARNDEVLVPCAHCGVRLPRTEALPVGDAYFCCTQHRDAHQKDA
ncbi:MAG TPA: PP0621 family protein [Burkholderiaceae bacterium]|nr:PP0621 family protein [Burkholderiaceae bacterium]